MRANTHWQGRMKTGSQATQADSQTDKKSVTLKVKVCKLFIVGTQVQLINIRLFTYMVIRLITISHKGLQKHPILGKSFK